MPERFRPDFARRASSPAEPTSKYTAPEGQEDPLVELARIVAGPSSFDVARQRRGSQPQPAALDENLESELTNFSAGPADDNRSGVEPPGAGLDWPRTEQGQPEAAPEEADFDEFAHMHLRQTARPDPRRAVARGLPAAPAETSWPPMDLDNPLPAHEAHDPIATIEHAAQVVGEAGQHHPYGDYYADQQNDPMLIEGTAADDTYRVPGDGPDADFSVGRYGEEGFDPLPEYHDQPPPPARSRGIGRGLMMAGAVAAVVILGGVGAIAYMSMDAGTSGAPRVIAADNKPVKVTPPPQANNNSSTAAANNKLIYDRVDDPNGDKLKAGETPITTTPRPDQRTTEASREISRIILPDSSGAGAGPNATAGTGGAAPATAGGAPDTTRPTPVASNAGDGIPMGARKVRTVVVRPDGTIISSGPSAGTDTTASAASTAAAGASGRPATGTTGAATGSAATGAAAGTRSTSGAGGTSVAANSGSSGTTSVPLTPNRTTTTTITAGQGVTTATSGATGSAANTANTANANQRTATRDTGGPISLVPNSGAAGRTGGTNTAAIAPGADGYVVQVTSQKSESAAATAYRDLQKRFPSLLGDKQPDMQRVDLGTRGVFFRVRVGPVGTQEAANSFCDNLKGAGADCVVVKN